MYKTCISQVYKLFIVFNLAMSTCDEGYICEIGQNVQICNILFCVSPSTVHLKQGGLQDFNITENERS